MEVETLLSVGGAVGVIVGVLASGMLVRYARHRAHVTSHKQAIQRLVVQVESTDGVFHTVVDRDDLDRDPEAKAAVEDALEHMRSV